MNTTATTLTFAKLKRLDPRLAALERDARLYAVVEGRKWRRCCGNRIWYRLMKPRLVWLVGWQRQDKHPVLSSAAAYDVAYEFLYDIMPDCRECGCL